MRTVAAWVELAGLAVVDAVELVVAGEQAETIRLKPKPTANSREKTRAERCLSICSDRLTTLNSDTF
jgi:hypothetical protein